MMTSNTFPLFSRPPHQDVKDPCLVFDGRQWHIFGSGGSSKREVWSIVHATAPAADGPWTFHASVRLDLAGRGVAAPGVVFDEGRFHLFIQTEFMWPNGTIEYFVSDDGFDWQRRPTVMQSVPGTGESGIYDPHPAMLHGRRYLVYSAFANCRGAPQPEIFLAVSETDSWDGPWQRLGCILDHAAIAAHHNQLDHHDYEWGIEGAQLVELPNGKILLNAVCFLPDGHRGQRQRVFFAIADAPDGPYRSLGPVITPRKAGENGHASVLVENDRLVVCYQQRWFKRFWRYGIARFSWQGLVDRLEGIAQGA
jgi:hypothetical protein